MIYLRLFYEFFKIGLFSIGGGLATIPFLQDLAERTNWYSVSFITDMIAISESTPGPIGINMATYVGNTVVGNIGGIIATIGEILPSLIIVILVSKFLSNFNQNQKINHAFYGIRPIVTALIAAACLDVFKVAVLNNELIETKGILGSVDFINLILFILIFILIRKFKKHPVIYIFISGVIGIILGL